MYLRVAGFTLHVIADDLELPLAPSRAAERFLIDPAPPDVEITVAMADLGGGHRPEECLFDSGGTWRLYRHERGLLFQCFAAQQPDIPYKTALVDLTDRDRARAHVQLHRPFFAGERAIDPLEYPLDELLVITLLGRRRGVEIHACAVIDGESGWLFVGQSGAGKSTMARLWLAEPRAVILSDDRVVLRADADEVWMYGTPWHGDEPLASPQHARLDGIFFLRHADRHVVTPVSSVKPADAVTRLFAASFPPFHDPEALDFTLSFLDRVARTVSCVELGFIPDAGAIDMVRTSSRRTR